MSRGQRRRGQGDRGAATITFAIAAGVVMLLVVQMDNVLVFQWGQGVVRAALDEGARIGARTGDPTACVARADGAISDLAAGMANGVTVSCAVNGQVVTATAIV